MRTISLYISQLVNATHVFNNVNVNPETVHSQPLRSQSLPDLSDLPYCWQSFIEECHLKLSNAFLKYIPVSKIRRLVMLINETRKMAIDKFYTEFEYEEMEDKFQNICIKVEKYLWRHNYTKEAVESAFLTATKEFEEVNASIVAGKHKTRELEQENSDTTLLTIMMDLTVNKN